MKKRKNCKSVTKKPIVVQAINGTNSKCDFCDELAETDGRNFLKSFSGESSSNGHHSKPNISSTPIQDENSYSNSYLKDSFIKKYIASLPERRITRQISKLTLTTNNKALEINDKKSVNDEVNTQVSIVDADHLSTSDYGSKSSRDSSGGSTDKDSNTPVESIDSGASVHSCSKVIKNDLNNCIFKKPLVHCELNKKAPLNLDLEKWDIEDENNTISNNISNAEEWDEAADRDYFDEVKLKHQPYLMKRGNNYVLIPKINLLNLSKDIFEFDILNSDSYMPLTSMRVKHISDVVSLTPQGLLFQQEYPALIFLSVNVEPEDENCITCLCSTTNMHEKPIWKPLSKQFYYYSAGQVIIHTCYFSLFTLVYEEPMLEVHKKIRRRIGGRIRIDSMPGIEVHFPRGSCSEDIDAYVKVLYDHEPLPLNKTEQLHGALASPIIMLGPHGYKFNTSKDPVEIYLPIPHYGNILELFPRSNLTIWQSSTGENEPLQWELLEVERQSFHHYRNGIVAISFPVHHFSFFKVVWDILSNNLCAAKMGMSYFYPWISFPMKCQAFMEENPDTKAFGLEIICFNSEGRDCSIQSSNYPHCVGSSLKPKLVKPGKIMIKLKSQKFIADEAAGEDPSLIKEENDFRGRDFEKQYACVFKESVSIDRGTFGKVFVERVSQGIGNNEILFEFNLKKSGCETEMTQNETSDRWSIVAVKELAGHLALTEESNWKNFAQYIGFTRSEIKGKLQYSTDPFMAMMNLYQNRGGTPEEFVQALYAVSRDMKNQSINSSSQSTPGSSSSGISGTGSQHSQNSNTGIIKKFSFFNLTPWKNQEVDSDSGTADMNASPAGQSSGSRESRKRSLSMLPARSSASRPSKRPRTYSIVNRKDSSSDESGHDELEEDELRSVSTQNHKRNPLKLYDQDLWLISSCMNAINWRALGRTLGLEESILLNLEHAHKGSGFRECAYQMLLEWKGQKPKKCTFGELYTALTKEKINGTAKHMANLLKSGSLNSTEAY